MLAREAEEDRKRREEEMAKEEAEEAEARKDEGRRKKRGIIIANWTFPICHQGLLDTTQLFAQFCVYLSLI